MKYFETYNDRIKTNHINFKQTDLEQDFNILNKNLFQNRVKNIPLKWFRSKDKLGLFTFNDEMSYIEISTFYNLTRQQYLDILAHEMIHVFIHQQNIKDNDDHGKEFIRIMNSINSKHKEFNIKPSENADFYSVNNVGKTKEYGVILFEIDGEFSHIVTSEKVIENRKMLEDFIQKLLTYTQQIGNIFEKDNIVLLRMFKSSMQGLSKFKIKQKLTLNNMSLYVTSDDLVDKLKKEPMVSEIKIKG